MCFRDIHRGRECDIAISIYPSSHLSTFILCRKLFHEPLILFVFALFLSCRVPSPPDTDVTTHLIDCAARRTHSSRLCDPTTLSTDPSSMTSPSQARSSSTGIPWPSPLVEKHKPVFSVNDFQASSPEELEYDASTSRASSSASPGLRLPRTSVRQPGYV